jgi:plastocyanin
MKRFAITLGLAALTGCASGLNRPVREVTATTGPDRVQRVRVTAHSFWFDPARIVVKRGVPVELTVHNGAWLVPHDFSCRAPEAGIEADASLGMFHGTKRVRFTPTRDGEYRFFCDVDHHSRKGMVGKIVVVD